MASRSVTLLSIMALLGTLLPSFASAVDAPNHSMDFGYYYAYGKYGDFPDVDCYTNIYFVDRASFATSVTDSQYPAALGQFLSGVASRGKKVILDLNLDNYPGLFNDILTAASPYWDSVAYVELADEPGWSQSEVNTKAAGIKNAITAHSLASRPVGVTFNDSQMLASAHPQEAANLDFVGVEAYLNPPGGDSAANTNALNAKINQLIGSVPGNKSIILIMQAYNRNGTWTNISTLTDLQSATYDLAKNNPRVAALTMFAYGRPGGTHDNPQLADVHKQIGQAMGFSCNGSSYPAPTDNCPTTVAFVCGADGETYINKCVAENRYQTTVDHDGACVDTVFGTDQSGSEQSSIVSSVKNISRATPTDLITSAQNGDIVEFTTKVSVNGSSPLAVNLQASLPDGLIYIDQSTKVAGQAIADNITSDTVPIGSVDSTKPVYVTFRAKVQTSSTTSLQSFAVTMTSSDDNGGSSNSSVWVSVSQPSSVIKIDVSGRDLTRATAAKTYIQAAPGSKLGFTITITPLIAISEVIIQNKLPDNITPVAGSVTLDGKAVPDDLFTSQGLSFGGAKMGQPIVVTFNATAGTTAVFPTGTTALIDTIQVGTTGQSDVIAQFPIQIVNGGIAGISQVSTGYGITFAIAGSLASLAAFSYMAYAHTNAFRRRQIAKSSQRNERIDFN